MMSYIKSVEDLDNEMTQIKAICEGIIEKHDGRINEAMETENNKCGCDACKVAREILEVMSWD